MLKRIILVSITLAFAIVGMLTEQAVLAQKGIAENVLRFHVLANSDSSDDQAMKLRVRDAVIDYVQGLGGENLADTKTNILDNLNNIEEVARGVEGNDYNVVAKLGNFEFPTKDYGDISLPSGIYEALRIEIGEAEGHNWWCVVYPNICFIGEGAVLPESSKEQLQGVVSENEYALISGKSPLKFRILEALNAIRK